MLFNSFNYIIFFALVTVSYFLISSKYRWIFLLLASYYFYMSWKVEYVLLLLFSTTTCYLSALGMSDIRERRVRLLYLMFGCITNLGVLFAFKYFNLFNNSLRTLFAEMNIPYDIANMNVLLPIGISFFTFQNISYIVDVYKNRIKPEVSLGRYALYISFFPQLVAGPIVRAEHLLPQLRDRVKVDNQKIIDGLRYMIWGFFKKVVIADNCARYVNAVYNNVNNYTGLSYVVATYLFAFQIYCDFSGYTDIAIGSSRVLGIELVKNFRSPYLSKNVIEFWRRWHISLSTWLRDYLYIPLGGNRHGRIKTVGNLMITMVLGGLWHGANWTFLVWGAFHGVLLVISRGVTRATSSIIQTESGRRIWDILSMIVTFNLVCLGWIFFRANTVSDAVRILDGIVASSFELSSFSSVISKFEFLILICLLFLFLCLDYIQNKQSDDYPFQMKRNSVRWCIDYALLVMILIFGKIGLHEFIYFQF